jgi:hypothetical protein
MYLTRFRPGDNMKSSRGRNVLLLVVAVFFSGVVGGQSMRAQELEAYRLNLQEQVKAGKITGQEAASLISRKQDEINRQAGSDNARAKPPGTGSPGLICQTYPDGRTECR